MRVLYLTDNPNRASSTVPTEGWLRFLRPRGLQPVLVSHRIGAFHAWALDQGIPAYHIPMPFPRKIWPWPFLHSVGRLCRIIRRHAIELVHSNEHGVYPVAQMAARVCRVPIVVGVHSEMAPAYFQWAFKKRRRPQRVFFISRASRERSGPGIAPVVPPANWRLLYNGVDLERFRPDAARRHAFREHHRLGDSVALGIACAIRPGKQLEHLVQATQRLHARPWRFLLAGTAVPGEEHYARRFLDCAHRQLGERFLHLGHLDHVLDFYNGLDLVVNTSKIETCSITILEALACGCPVVGYPSLSVAEQVLPEGGQMVEQDNLDLLHAALERWVSDPALCRQARVGARRRAEQDFDIRRIADQLWEEYHAVLREFHQNN